jgi:hypothetical protein
MYTPGMTDKPIADPGLLPRAPAHSQALPGAALLNEPLPLTQSLRAALPERSHLQPPGPEAGALPGAGGSRRRRVWELPDYSYCPVIGVCLPLDVLRRLVARVTDGPAAATDYELHCSAIGDCKRRTPLAELVQRELDRRYAVALRQSTSCKDAESLAGWWRDAAARGEVAGALWAAITHPRCSLSVEDEVLHDVHMLQHQAGAGARAELEQLAGLKRHNAELASELDELRRRSAEQQSAHARRLEQLQATILQLRAELISRDTALAMLRERAAEAAGAIPALNRREERAQVAEEGRAHDSERQTARIQDLKQALQRTRQDLVREQQRADAALRTPQPAAPVDSVVTLAATACARLDDQAVLCVGGRQASVPVYRSLVERTGGKFLHHDGGEDDGAARLEATLAAADLVICQTGCLSHDAYWRVKSHCKRTGKPCVFVEKPSAASLKRALLALTGSGEQR